MGLRAPVRAFINARAGVFGHFSGRYFPAFGMDFFLGRGGGRVENAWELFRDDKKIPPGS